MRFAPLFGRFCPIFLHLVQELTPNFGDYRNKFCNIFVTILPHLFRFGETSCYGGKKCRFSSFSGCGEVRGSASGLALSVNAFRRCHLSRSERQELFRHILGSHFGKDSPGRGRQELSRNVLGSPFGRAVAVRRLRGLACHFRQQPCPLRHPFGMPPPPKWEARAIPPRSWLSLRESCRR